MSFSKQHIYIYAVAIRKNKGFAFFFFSSQAEGDSLGKQKMRYRTAMRALPPGENISACWEGREGRGDGKGEAVVIGAATRNSRWVSGRTVASPSPLP